MFYINKDAELTFELLQKMINKFNIEVLPRLNKYKNYYDKFTGMILNTGARY